MSRKLVEMRIASLVTRGNLRERMRDPEVVELARSILDVELIHPITVNRRTKEVIAGHDRLAACMRLERKTIPAFLVEVTPAEAKRIEIVENLRRRPVDRDRLLADLAKLETAEGGISGQVDQQLPAASPGPGRPKSPQTIAREKAAEVAGVSPEAIRAAEKRERARAAPPSPAPAEPPIRTFGLEAPPDVLESAVRAQSVLDGIDRDLRQAQARISQLQSEGLVNYSTLLNEVHQAAQAVRMAAPVSLCPFCKALEALRPDCASCGGVGWAAGANLWNVPPALMAEGEEACVRLPSGALWRVADLDDVADADPDKLPF